MIKKNTSLSIGKVVEIICQAVGASPGSKPATVHIPSYVTSTIHLPFKLSVLYKNLTRTFLIHKWI